MAPRSPLSVVGGEAPFVDAGPGCGPADALVLDIGDDIGALVIYADEQCLGAEIDLSAEGRPRSHHVHTMIRRRRASGSDVVAGVFPQLLAGRYTLWGLDGVVMAPVVIEGGRVSEVQVGDCRPGSHDDGTDVACRGGRDVREHQPRAGTPTA